MILEEEEEEEEEEDQMDLPGTSLQFPIFNNVL